MPTNRALGRLLGSLAVTLFAASLPMTRLAVLALDPWFVTTARGGLAGLVAASCLALMRRRPPVGVTSAARGDRPLPSARFPGLMAIAMPTVPRRHGGVILGLIADRDGGRRSGRRPRKAVVAVLGDVAALGASLVVAFSLGSGALCAVPGDASSFVFGSGLQDRLCVSGRHPRSLARLGGDLLGGGCSACRCSCRRRSSCGRRRDPAAVPSPPWAGLLYVALVSQYFGFLAVEHRRSRSAASPVSVRCSCCSRSSPWRSRPRCSPSRSRCGSSGLPPRWCWW